MAAEWFVVGEVRVNTYVPVSVDWNGMIDAAAARGRHSRVRARRHPMVIRQAPRITIPPSGHMSGTSPFAPRPPHPSGCTACQGAEPLDEQAVSQTAIAHRERLGAELRQHCPHDAGAREDYLGPLGL